MCACSSPPGTEEPCSADRWDVGSCLRMVHKTKQVDFEPVFECCTVGAFLMAAGNSLQILGAQ